MLSPLNKAVASTDTGTKKKEKGAVRRSPFLLWRAKRLPSSFSPGPSYKRHGDACFRPVCLYTLSTEWHRKSRTDFKV